MQEVLEEDGMRRFLIGAGWCFLLWMGTTMLGGMVVGVIAVSATDDPARATQAASEAGNAFGLRYGNLVLLTSMAVATVGTLTGWLPGTRGEKDPH
jgi:cytochrome c biogenesis factor